MDFYDQCHFDRKLGLWVDRSGYPVTERGLPQQPNLTVSTSDLELETLVVNDTATIDILEAITADIGNCAVTEVTTPLITAPAATLNLIAKTTTGHVYLGNENTGTTKLDVLPDVNQITVQIASTLSNVQMLLSGKGSSGVAIRAIYTERSSGSVQQLISSTPSALKFATQEWMNNNDAAITPNGTYDTWTNASGRGIVVFVEATMWGIVQGSGVTNNYLEFYTSVNGYSNYAHGRTRTRAVNVTGDTLALNTTGMLYVPANQTFSVWARSFNADFQSGTTDTDKQKMNTISIRVFA